MRARLLAVMPAAWAVLISWGVLIIDRPVRHRINGDFFDDTMAGITQVLSGDATAVYGGAQRPLMMPLSILLEAPAVWLVRTFGGGWLLGASDDLGAGITTETAGANMQIAAQSDYLAACAAALIISGLVVGYATWWALRTLRPAQRLAYTLGAVTVLLANPLSLSAIRWGHPEELLMTALIASAFLCAWGGGWRLSAVAIGLAIATKQPAALVWVALLMAVPRPIRWRYAALSIGTTLIVTLPMVIGSFREFIGFNTTGALRGAGDSEPVFTLVHYMGAESFLGTHGKLVVVAIALIAPLILAWRRSWQLSVVSAAALSAGILLTRNLIDPWNITYYAAPVLGVALVIELALAPERRRWLPWGTFLLGSVLALAQAGWVLVIALALGVDRILAFCLTYLALAVAAYALALRRSAAPLGFGSIRARRLSLIAPLAVAVAIVAILGITRPELPDSTSAQRVERLDAIARAGGQRVYWLGERPLAGGAVSAAATAGVIGRTAPIAPGSDISATQIAYSTADADVTVAVISHPRSARSPLTRIDQCAAGRCPEGATRIETPLGPGALTTDSYAGQPLMMATVRTRAGNALTLSVLGARTWRQYLALLEPVSESTRDERRRAVEQER